jgi:hypothetical protein
MHERGYVERIERADPFAQRVDNDAAALALVADGDRVRVVAARRDIDVKA